MCGIYENIGYLSNLVSRKRGQKPVDGESHLITSHLISVSPERLSSKQLHHLHQREELGKTKMAYFVRFKIKVSSKLRQSIDFFSLSYSFLIIQFVVSTLPYT